MRESIGLSEDQPSRARRYAPDAVFVILTLVVIAIRAKALANGGAPPGFDGGDWLAVGHGLFGNAVRPSGATAAPFVPALVALSVSIVGRQAAFVGAGALCSVIPGIGAYIALRRFSPGVGATLLGGLALAAAWVGEPASWGGYPQLVAIGLLPIVVMTADHAIAHLSYRAALGGGLALLLVALTSDFVFAMTLSGTVMVVALGF
ncbi:MAG: hypothetical protein QOF21_2331, partial [Actinomycetota bacterium]